MPCSGEEISPKQASANGHCSRLYNSRLGEGSSPERESLSPKRGAVRGVGLLLVFFVFGY